MAERGLWSLLGSSRTIRGLALLGLACSVSPHRAFVQDRFVQAGLDLEDTLADVKRATETYGYPPPVLDLGDALFTTV
jgi:hypothetical protein